MSDIPDFMREFDTSTDYGFTPVSSKPADDSKPVSYTHLTLPTKSSV